MVDNFKRKLPSVVQFKLKLVIVFSKSSVQKMGKAQSVCVPPVSLYKAADSWRARTTGNLLPCSQWTFNTHVAPSLKPFLK